MSVIAEVQTFLVKLLYGTKLKRFSKRGLFIVHNKYLLILIAIYLIVDADKKSALTYVMDEKKSDKI